MCQHKRFQFSCDKIIFPANFSISRTWRFFWTGEFYAAKQGDRVKIHTPHLEEERSPSSVIICCVTVAIWKRLVSCIQMGVLHLYFTSVPFQIYFSGAQSHYKCAGKWSRINVTGLVTYFTFCCVITATNTRGKLRGTSKRRSLTILDYWSC